MDNAIVHKIHMRELLRVEAMLREYLDAEAHCLKCGATPIIERAPANLDPKYRAFIPLVSTKCLIPALDIETLMPLYRITARCVCGVRFEVTSWAI